MQDDKEKRKKKAQAEMDRISRRAPSASEQIAYKAARERLVANYESAANSPRERREPTSAEKNQMAVYQRSAASENQVLSAAEKQQRMGRDIPLAATPEIQLAKPLINRNK